MNSEIDASREIYIIIDPSRISTNSLDMVMILAELLKVGVSAGLFSNELLRQVACLPFATEILVASGKERTLGRERVESSESRNAILVQHLLEQKAQMRKISFRIERFETQPPLGGFLESKRDIFLPASNTFLATRTSQQSSVAIRVIKWVYDNCAASERCFLLLQELVKSGFTRTVYVFGNKAVPERMMSVLADCGARVFWIGSKSEEELLATLTAGSAADLVMLPSSFSCGMGEEKLQQLNRHCIAPILVVG